MSSKRDTFRLSFLLSFSGEKNRDRIPAVSGIFFPQAFTEEHINNMKGRAEFVQLSHSFVSPLNIFFFLTQQVCVWKKAKKKHTFAQRYICHGWNKFSLLWMIKLWRFPEGGRDKAISCSHKKKPARKRSRHGVPKPEGWKQSKKPIGKMRKSNLSSPDFSQQEWTFYWHCAGSFLSPDKSATVHHQASAAFAGNNWISSIFWKSLLVMYMF